VCTATFLGRAGRLPALLAALPNEAGSGLLAGLEQHYTALSEAPVHHALHADTACKAHVQPRLAQTQHPAKHLYSRVWRADAERWLLLVNELAGDSVGLGGLSTEHNMTVSRLGVCPTTYAHHTSALGTPQQRWTRRGALRTSQCWFVRPAMLCAPQQRRAGRLCPALCITAASGRDRFTTRMCCAAGVPEAYSQGPAQLTPLDRRVRQRLHPCSNAFHSVHASVPYTAFSVSAWCLCVNAGAQSGRSVPRSCRAFVYSWHLIYPRSARSHPAPFRTLSILGVVAIIGVDTIQGTCAIIWRAEQRPAEALCSLFWRAERHAGTGSASLAGAKQRHCGSLVQPSFDR
jgi:hypothetical protein